jgi:ribosomal protein S18 acetylase RimI-like enzyme
MIRDFRFSDASRLFELLRTNFPEEERVYGTRPESWNEVVKRIHRPSVRFVVAFARLFRRPIYRFFTIEEDGRLVATSLVSFAPRIGYISTVMVDAGYRRRGYARRLLAQCHQEIASFHRPYAVLDVLTDNTPARTLYVSDGYRSLRTSALYSLPLTPEPSAPRPSGPGRIRPYQTSDRRTLAAIADRAVPREVARVLPPAGRRLNASPTIDQILSSASSSWTLEEGGRPTAWVSAISSKFMEAAGLAAPIVATDADPSGVRALLATAVDWCRVQLATRVICRVPNDNVASVRAVESEGFTSTLSFDTLYRSLP